MAKEDKRNRLYISGYQFPHMTSAISLCAVSVLYVIVLGKNQREVKCTTVMFKYCNMCEIVKTKLGYLM